MSKATAALLFLFFIPLGLLQDRSGGENPPVGNGSPQAGKAEPTPAPSSPHQIVSRIYGVFDVFQFGEPAGNAEVRLDPYGPTPENRLVYRSMLSFEAGAAAGLERLKYKISYKVIAEISETHELRRLEFEGEAVDGPFRILFDATKDSSSVEILRKGETVRAPVPADAELAIVPEVGFLKIAQRTGLAQQKTLRFALWIPGMGSDRLQIVEFLQGAQVPRRYADLSFHAYRYSTNKATSPAEYNPHEYHVDPSGRVVEWTTADQVNCRLSREVQYIRATKPIRTWYRAIYNDPQTQEERHIGWARTQYTPVPGGGWDVEIERQVTVTAFEAVRQSREMIRARLTPELKIGRLNYRREFAGRETVGEYDGIDPKIKWYVGGTLVQETEIPRDQEFAGTLEMGLFRLTQAQEFLRAQEFMLVLLVPETRELKPVVITLNGVGIRRYLGADVYTLWTQVTVDLAPVADVYLDRFGRPLEISLREDYEFEKTKLRREGVKYLAVPDRSMAVVQRGGGPAPPPSGLDIFASRKLFRKPKASEIALQQVRTAFHDVQRQSVLLDSLVTFQEWERVAELLPDLIAASERLNQQVEDYRSKLLADERQDLRVAVWVQRAQEWINKITQAIPKEIRLERQFRESLLRFDQALTSGRLEEAEAIATTIDKLLLDPILREQVRDDWKRQWDPRRATLATAVLRRNLENLPATVSVIALEKDHLLHPVRVRVGPFGAVLDLRDTLKIPKVRGFAIMRLGDKPQDIYQIGDELEVSGMKLRIQAIERDFVTLAVGQLTREVRLER